MIKVTYREFDSKKDVPEFCALFWEYWLHVNGEDQSDEVEVEVLGVPVKMHRIEKTLYGYLGQGFRIELVVTDDADQAIVGFLVYRRVCDVVLDVRHMWLEAEFRNSKAGAGLVHKIAAEYPIREVIFQTRNEKKPDLLLGHTKGRRRVLHEGKRLTTWAMEWGDHGR